VQFITSRVRPYLASSSDFCFSKAKKKKSRFAHGRRPGADRRTGNVDFYGRFNFVYATLKKTVLVFLYGIV
jgi:hypothetical protein